MTRPIGSDALIAGLMAPTTNWGQVMAAKDNQLQQQTYLTQQSEQELLQEQQAAAQIANFQQKIRTLPLERPDKVRVSKWLLGQEKSIADRLENSYQGSLKKFMAVEGAAWMDHTLGALEQSNEYQTGLHNLEQITLAKEAMRKGENLIGEVRDVNGTKQYISADKRIADYYAGKLPKFDFQGSYKDDDNLLKHFSEQYAPNKLPYEQTAVDDKAIQEYLLAANPREVAEDKYHRKYRGAQIYYKTKPLDELVDFKLKQQDHQMKVADHNRKGALDNLRAQGLQLSNQIKQTKLAGLQNAGADGTDPGAYLRHMIPQSTDQPGVAYVQDDELKGHKVLRHSGYDLGSFGGGSTGKVGFKALDVYDKESAGALGSLVGAEKVPVSKENPTGWRGGKILEGIVPQNGFNAIDLSGTSHQIVHIDNKIYTNPREFGQSGQPLSPNGPMGFVKVTLRMDSNSDAKQAGLLEGMFNSSTRIGAGTYNKDTREITLYAPVGALYKNAALNRYFSNQDAGQKVTNEYANPYALGLDDDD
ncbi:hypothetical protein EXU85_24335 [Spirosoma sp. KCTC 42546]|uniref:hypothetical protein n=1 Tax=Spirosoma sp. KCTC 42546 TaxID=2520506 RepID=UPI00115B64BF|nr:hypothetical protein [Spirosoma sp. KCTC 42546]QDK81567.1 hypothetical protein EXU85_24335 [Spirosoma sp. KCTC 42546]